MRQFRLQFLPKLLKAYPTCAFIKVAHKRFHLNMFKLVKVIDHAISPNEAVICQIQKDLF